MGKRSPKRFVLQDVTHNGIRPISITTKKQLQTLLEGFRDRTEPGVIKLTSPAGDFFTIGIGGPYISIEYTLDPNGPYPMVRGNLHLEQVVVKFICGGEPTPIESKYIIAYEEGVEIIISFFRTGKPPDSVQWDPDLKDVIPQEDLEEVKEVSFKNEPRGTYNGITLDAMEAKVLEEISAMLVKSLEEIGPSINCLLPSMDGPMVPKNQGFMVKRGHITNLALFNTPLTSLPESIGSLRSLKSLYLVRNCLSSLPIALQELTKLDSLNLAENKLTSIPATIGTLHSLRSLNLSDNKLIAIPGGIGQLESLQYLDLDHNQLSSIPEEIGNLQSLTGLKLHNNQLTSLPPAIGHVKSLEFLNLQNNSLVTLPEEIGSLRMLETLLLENNKLSSLPESMGQLTSLQILNLEGNKLPTLPESIMQLTSLEALNLKGNNLTTLPEKVERWLETLSRRGCEISR